MDKVHVYNIIFHLNTLNWRDRWKFCFCAIHYIKKKINIHSKTLKKLFTIERFGVYAILLTLVL